MHARVVKHQLALRHAEESRALLERLRPHFRHFHELLAAHERAILLAVSDDIFRERFVQPRNLAQQGRRRGVDVHADGVDAVLHHALEGFAQPFLRHIVLILPYANGLGIDLNQLRQGILEPPRDGYRRTQVDVVLRELLRGELARRIDGRARLVDDHIAHALCAGDELHGHLLRFTGGGSVADCNMLHRVFLHKRFQLFNCLLLLPFAEGRIDHRRVEHLTRIADHGNLAAIAITRIEPHRHVPLDRRLHQKGFEVEREVMYCALVGKIGQRIARFALHAGEDQTVIRVLCRGINKFARVVVCLDGGALHCIEREFPIQIQIDLEEPFLLPAVDRENLVALELCHRLIKLIIEPIDRVLFLGGDGADLCVFRDRIAQFLADAGILGDRLRDDIGRARERLLHGIHSLFRVDKRASEHLQRRQFPPLREDLRRERLQSFFLCDGCARTPLLFIGTIQILQYGEGLRLVNLTVELLRELVLGGDGLLYLLPPLGEISEIGEPLKKVPEGGVIHRSMHLLAIARDERDGISLVNQIDNVFHVCFALVKFPCEKLNLCLHVCSLFLCATPHKKAVASRAAQIAPTI
ncbi:hypothetical protein SDC9_82275 [bioreactor metagenome]|uniref:Uncharacterized protein n=1 Tax=bioreactor metagenome TaxID=1076179 RepID=A0A644Z4G6_9ZZZZ